MADPGSLWNCSEAVCKAERKWSDRSEVFMMDDEVGGVVALLAIHSAKVVISESDARRLEEMLEYKDREWRTRRT